VRISLGTDAHHPWQLAFMNFSLAAPLLTEINRDRILNFMPVDELRAWSNLSAATRPKDYGDGSACSLD
jgi:histidinol phosphatase-like PHP family hydrolase